MKELCGAAVGLVVLLLPSFAPSQSKIVQPNPSFTSPGGTPSLVDNWMPFITKASKRFGIPAAWIRAVIRIESNGQTTLNGVPITSAAGAMGLMQVMPDTFADMKTRYGLGDDPYDPENNIAAGTAFLHEMYLRYGYPDLFAAYNAGPARFDQFLNDRTPLPVETSAYLQALGQVQFTILHPDNFADGSSKNFTELYAGIIGEGRSNLALEAPGVVGFVPSSHGLFVNLQTQLPNKPQTYKTECQSFECRLGQFFPHN